MYLPYWTWKFPSQETTSNGSGEPEVYTANDRHPRLQTKAVPRRVFGTGFIPVVFALLCGGLLSLLSGCVSLNALHKAEKRSFESGWQGGSKGLVGELARAHVSAIFLADKIETMLRQADELNKKYESLRTVQCRDMYFPEKGIELKGNYVAPYLNVTPADLKVPAKLPTLGGKDSTAKDE